MDEHTQPIEGHHDGAPQFLKLQKDGMGVYARSLRLKENDVLVAINGNLFTGDAEMLRSFFGIKDQNENDAQEDENDEDEKECRYLLTFWRDGVFFHLVFNHPLMATYNFTQYEESTAISKSFSSLSYASLEKYENYEIFKDVYRKAGIHSIKPDPIATIAPSLWMLNHRLYYPMLAIIVVYAITLMTHWVMFIISYILVSFYTRRAQIDLLRSYQLFAEKYFWMVLAATNEIKAQEKAREFDRKLLFKFDKPNRNRKKNNRKSAGGTRPKM